MSRDIKLAIYQNMNVLNKLKNVYIDLNDTKMNMDTKVDMDSEFMLIIYADFYNKKLPLSG